MKKTLTALCLSIASISFACPPSNDVASNAPTESDCIVIISSRECVMTDRTVACYRAAVGNDIYDFRVVTVPSGVNGTGYQVSYTQPGQRGLSFLNTTLYSKEDAISNFVHEIYGSTCTYQYK